MQMLGRAISGLTSAAAFIGMLCVAIMMLHVTADVSMRWLLNAPIDGTITIVANYYMVVIGFIALGVAEEQDAHISVEIVSDLMPRGIQKGLGGFASLLSAVAFGFVTVRGWEVALNQTATGTSVQQGTQIIPIWPSYWAIPIGGALMALVAFYKFIVSITGARSGLAKSEAEVIND